MANEDILRQYIIQHYKTVKAFCQKADIPTSTMDNILNRQGLSGARIEIGSKICNTLNISLDSLAEGQIAPRRTSDITISEQATIDLYAALSPEDREIVDFILNRNSKK